MSDNSTSESESHFAPTVRLCEVVRQDDRSCGFHLTRTKWDPYPWVSAVETESAAQQAGLQVGDCLLEVNGDDVLGQRISEIASRVRSRPEKASLLVWNSGAETGCDPEALCCGPMPSSLQRLSSCLSSILGSLECPVCLDTIPPPAHQCGNGHLICLPCRARAERCPVCRVRFSRGRSLLADQVFQSLTEAFNLRGTPEADQSARLRQKLLGNKSKKSRPTPEFKVNFAASPTNKFLTRLMGKSSSVDNLAFDSESVRLSAMPRHLSITPDSEFGPELKTKSLSSSEIFRTPSTPCPGSPNARRSDKGNLLQSLRPGSGLLDKEDVPLGTTRRPASYHGSCENLRMRLASDFPDDNSEDSRDASDQYRCPWTPSCPVTLTSSRLLPHSRNHGLPFQLIYKPKVTVNLPLEGLLCVQLTGPPPIEFFLSFVKVSEEDSRIRAWTPASQDDIFCWRLIAKCQCDINGSSVLNVPIFSLAMEQPDIRSDIDNDSARIPPKATSLELDFSKVLHVQEERDILPKCRMEFSSEIRAGVIGKDTWR